MMELSPQTISQLPLLKVISSKRLAKDQLRKRLLSSASNTTLRVLINLIRLLAAGKLDIPVRTHELLRKNHSLFIRRAADKSQSLDQTRKFILRNFDRIIVSLILFLSYKINFS